MASWTLKGTSLSDNGTRVTCQGSKGAEAPAAILLVYGKDPGTFLKRVFSKTAFTDRKREDLFTTPH